MAYRNITGISLILLAIQLAVFVPSVYLQSCSARSSEKKLSDSITVSLLITFIIIFLFKSKTSFNVSGILCLKSISQNTITLLRHRKFTYTHTVFFYLIVYYTHRTLLILLIGDSNPNTVSEKL